MSDHYDILRDTQYGILGTNFAEVGTDCISRRAAIDALKKHREELLKGLDKNGNVYGIISASTGIAICTVGQLPSAQSEIYHCIDCALYNEPQCLMAFENACWAEPYGYCHMFTRKENDEDERPD